MLQAAADLLRSVLLPESFRRNQNHQESDFRNPIWNGDDDDDGDELYYNEDSTEGDMFNFYDSFDSNLEKFMREFTKTFESNMEHFSNSFFQLPNDFSNLAPPSENRSNLRDSYLLPGYQPRSSNIDENVDTDVDGKVGPDILSKFFNDGSKSDQIVEKPSFKNSISPHFFSQTIITTTVTKPDGTVETKKIIRDHQGNEKTTTITTHKNAIDDNLKVENFPHDEFLNVWKQLFWK